MAAPALGLTKGHTILPVPMVEHDCDDDNAQEDRDARKEALYAWGVYVHHVERVCVSQGVFDLTAMPARKPCTHWREGSSHGRNKFRPRLCPC